jgi:hypothetical protein
MLSSTNFWMCLAGLIYLVVGVFVIQKEISAARGREKLITLGCVFFAVPLAVFAPEHFRGPDFVKESVPSWMPVRWFWPYFVGCALVVAATSLTLRKFVRLSSTLLGLMFSLFVCMIYVPSALENPTVAATIEMDDFIRAHRHSNRRHLFRRRTFPASELCARHSSAHDDANMGSLPQPMGIPRRSNPAGGWHCLGPEQKGPSSRNLDWRTNDRPHRIPISAYLDSRSRRAGGHCRVELRRGHIALRRRSTPPGISLAARSRSLGENVASNTYACRLLSRVPPLGIPRGAASSKNSSSSARTEEMSRGQHRDDEKQMGRAGRVNLKRKEAENRENQRPSAAVQTHGCAQEKQKIKTKRS